ncbi:MAG: AAA family ATPase [Pseudomonadota bacterium]
MRDLLGWLKECGLEKYVDILRENDVDLDVVSEVGESDLKEFGFSFGDRKRFLRGVRLLDAELVAPVADAPPEAAGNATIIEREPGEAERRQLTVMFCDLVGSTALSQSMDPEDYRGLLSQFQSAVTSEIVGNHGFIARYMGDGVLAYFGYPAASENDPELAVRAGLGMVAAVSSIDSAGTLEVRVGVATGQVVVGDIIGEGASEEAAVLGDTPNLAARLQAAAAPNSVCIAESTNALLGERIETRALEPVSLKGLADPVVPYVAVRVRSVSEVDETRRDAYPLVGRDVELALLDRAWRTAASGQGQAVVLSGEAGVGKSRLLRAFRNAIAPRAPQYTWYCSPYHVATANYPFWDHLHRLMQRNQYDNLDEFDRLEHLLEGLGIWSREAVLLLARLAGVATLEAAGELDLPPDEVRRRTQQLQVNMLKATAAKGPTVLIIEDLHWVDPTTSEVLGQIIDEIAEDPILVLLTARPEYRCPWTDYPHVTQHSISHLSRTDTMALVQSIIEGQGLASELSQHVLERTDGVPLYVEELTKTLLESTEEVGIPASLQDSLMARLDRLGSTKELAQIASIIGRDFRSGALAALSQLPQDVVTTGLEALCDAGLVHRRRSQDGNLFEFKHALVRDAAYESLLRERRRELHGRLARNLDGSASPELIAFHYTNAKEWSIAAQHWAEAGGLAANRSAHLEAVEHYRNALQNLAMLEPEGDRSFTLACAVSLAFSYRSLGQPDDVLSTLDAHHAALRDSGTALERAKVHYLRGVACFVLGRVDETYEHESAALVAAREAGSAEFEARALSSLGDWAYASKRVQSACNYQQQCASLAEQHALNIVSVDNATCFEATQRHLFGTADTSYVVEYVDRARSANLPRAESILCAGAAWTFAHRDELARSLEFARRGVGAAEVAGSKLWRIFSLSAESRTLSLLGRRAQGRELALECVEVARFLGAAIVGGLSFGALAMAAHDSGELHTALSEGEAQLTDGDTAHCHVDFRRDAIDAGLAHGEWNTVLHHVGALRAFCELEPLRPADYIADRGEALATLGKDQRQPGSAAHIAALIAEGEALGLTYFNRALEAALREST